MIVVWMKIENTKIVVVSVPQWEEEIRSTSDLIDFSLFYIYGKEIEFLWEEDLRSHWFKTIK